MYRTCLLVILSVVVFGFVASVAATQESAESGGRIRVQLIPFQQTLLSSEISAKISRLPVREGDTFKENQPLVEFDCALLSAYQKKAEASADAARLTLTANKRLSEHNAVSNLELDLAAAKLKEAEAEADAMRVNVSKCVLSAPFNGRVVKLQIDAHQYATPGKALMEILDTGRLEVRMIVPSRRLPQLKPGTAFHVQIEELGGRSFSAQVTRTGAKIDSLSQTVVVLGEIEGRHPELLPGMTGWAVFQGGKRK